MLFMKDGQKAQIDGQKQITKKTKRKHVYGIDKGSVLGLWLELRLAQMTGLNLFTFVFSRSDSMWPRQYTVQ